MISMGAVRMLKPNEVNKDVWCDALSYLPDGDNYLDIISNRMNFLNCTHRGRAMTRGQRKKNRQQIQSCLQNTTNNTDTHLHNDQSLSSTDNDKESLSDLGGVDDDYLCEGDPGGMLNKQALKELDIYDIKDLLHNDINDSPPFEKQERKPPPQYHLESSRSNVTECLTNHTLQSYFRGRQLQDY
jgi:hypothetical protein